MGNEFVIRVISNRYEGLREGGGYRESSWVTYYKGGYTSTQDPGSSILLSSYSKEVSPSSSFINLKLKSEFLVFLKLAPLPPLVRDTRTSTSTFTLRCNQTKLTTIPKTVNPILYPVNLESSSNLTFTAQLSNTSSNK